MKREGDALRREFLTIAARPGRKFPAELRRRGRAFALAERRAGRSMAWIAETVGVSEQSVRRWVSDVEQRRSFVPVEVARDDARREVDRSAVLVSPKGYRVEGLSLSEIAQLVRELG